MAPVARGRRVDPTPTDMALLLDCWSAALRASGLTPPTSEDERRALALPFGSQPLGRRGRDLDLCLLAPVAEEEATGYDSDGRGARDKTSAVAMLELLANLGLPSDEIAANAPLLARFSEA